MENYTNLLGVNERLLNFACPLMKSNFSDLAIDMQSIYYMGIGSTAYIGIRERGTTYRECLYEFNEAVKAWGDSKILGACQIKKIDNLNYQFTITKE